MSVSQAGPLLPPPTPQDRLCETHTHTHTCLCAWARAHTHARTHASTEGALGQVLEARPCLKASIVPSREVIIHHPLFSSGRGADAIAHMRSCAAHVYLHTYAAHRQEGLLGKLCCV